MSDFINDKIFMPLLKLSEKYQNLSMIISVITLLVSIVKSLQIILTILPTPCKLIIPGLFEPPVRTLRATIPENESHIFR